MLFTEQKTKVGFVYKVKDVFGEMTFESLDKLDPKILDEIFLAIFNIKSKTEIIKGEIKETGIKYKFKKAKQWDKLDEEKEFKNLENLGIGKEESIGVSVKNTYFKQKRKMPQSLKRYWYRQDITMISLGLITGAIIVAIVWLISLNK